jgi:hypothetical protein
MKSFKKLLSEVAKGISGGELDFYNKHKVDILTDPNAFEHQFTGETEKFHNLADYKNGEDEAIYETFSRGDFIHVPGANGSMHPAIHLGTHAVYVDDDSAEKVPEKSLEGATKMKKVSSAHRANGNEYLKNVHEEIDSDDVGNAIDRSKVKEIKTKIIDEENLEENNAFVTAAVVAHMRKNKKFNFGGDKFPVTVKKDTVKSMTEEDDDDLEEAEENKSGEDLEKSHVDYKKKNASGNFNKQLTELDAYKLEKFYKRFRKEPKEPVNEEIETMSHAAALRLADRHYSAATKHKENGNIKAYGAHMTHGSAIEDAAIAAGRDMPVRSKRLEAKSDKIWSEHPLKSVNEENLDEATEKPKYQYYITKNTVGPEKKKLIHSKNKPFDTEREALDHIIKSGGRGDGIIHMVNPKTGNIVLNRGVSSGQKGYQSDVAGDDPRHIRDLKEDTSINEVSKATLKSYINKADKEIDKDWRDTKSKRPGMPERKLSNRVDGVHKARTKTGYTGSYFNEENLDEVSKDTLKRYADKADLELDADWLAKTDGSPRMPQRKVVNRLHGIYRANTKLPYKEEIEQIDEISKATLQSYSDKADKKIDKLQQSVVKSNDKEYKAELQGNRKKAENIFMKKKENQNKLDKKYAAWWRVRDVMYPDNAAIISRAGKNPKVAARINAYKEDLDEAYSAGIIKLKDGTSVSLKSNDARLLNDLLNNLNAQNRKKMTDVLTTDKSGFEEILGFAREAE